MDPVLDNDANIVADWEEPSRKGFCELGFHLACVLPHLAFDKINMLELEGGQCAVAYACQ